MPNLRPSAVPVPLGAAALVLVAGLLHARTAAADCGAFIGDEGDNLIFYGVQAEVFNVGSCVALHPAVTLAGQQAVVCWRDMHGNWNLEDVLGCDSGTDPDDEMLIIGAGGDDVIMPVIHRSNNEEFVCPIGGTSGELVPLGGLPASFGVLEWYGRSDLYSHRPGGSGCIHDAGCSHMPMGVTVVGGSGQDELHGGPEDDLVASSDIFGDPWCTPHGARGSGDSTIDACVCATDVTCCNSDWDLECVQLAIGCGADCSDLRFFPADDSQDILCGHGGTDTVVGDEDPAPFEYELLSGGPGAGDFCRGFRDPGPGCCSASTSPGCSVPAIEGPVCAADPYCCSNAWDNLCVGAVGDAGLGSCSVGVAPCCSTSTGAGCSDDAAIEAAVCAADAYCCTTQWDGICVGQVESVAGASCDRLEDIATSTCETTLEVSLTDVGDGAIARNVCADDDVESIPALPRGSAAAHTTYRIAADFFPPSCF